MLRTANGEAQNKTGEQRVRFRKAIAAAVCIGALSAIGVALAQDAETEKGIERYRQMLKEDPWSNPGLLDSDRGEA